MTIVFVFWFLMLLWLILGIAQTWPAAGSKPWPLAGSVLLWVLLALLGWAQFGQAIHR